jgi:hypothetical protein
VMHSKSISSLLLVRQASLCSVLQITSDEHMETWFLNCWVCTAAKFLIIPRLSCTQPLHHQTNACSAPHRLHCHAPCLCTNFKPDIVSLTSYATTQLKFSHLTTKKNCALLRFHKHSTIHATFNVLMRIFHLLYYTKCISCQISL